MIPDSKVERQRIRGSDWIYRSGCNSNVPKDFPGRSLIRGRGYSRSIFLNLESIVETLFR
jgi:hypothetical protein